MLFNPNEAAILNCRASGGPNNTFLWLFNSEIIVGVTNSILNLNEVEGGEYTCQVSNIAGSENDSIVLVGRNILIFVNKYYVYYDSIYLPV